MTVRIIRTRGPGGTPKQHRASVIVSGPCLSWSPSTPQGLCQSTGAIPLPTENPSCPGQRPNVKLLLENWGFIPGQKGFSQNWAPFREDYTLIALVSAGSLLPAEPWDWHKSLETLVSLSKDTEPSTGAWGPAVIFHSSWLNTGLPFGGLWSGQKEGPRGPMDSFQLTSVLGQRKTTPQAGRAA